MSEIAEFEQRVSHMIDRFEAKIDALSEHVREVREAQIKMDARNYDAAMEKLEAKLYKLEARVLTMEANDSRQKGAVMALEWAYKLGPWVLITAIAVVSFYRGWIG
jgi:Mg2+ and Co2+ transporter CorA